MLSISQRIELLRREIPFVGKEIAHYEGLVEDAEKILLEFQARAWTTVLSRSDFEKLNWRYETMLKLRGDVVALWEYQRRRRDALMNEMIQLEQS
jgi:Zn-dependent M32 family carboxypeptidase